MRGRKITLKANLVKNAWGEDLEKVLYTKEVKNFLKEALEAESEPERVGELN